MAKDMRAVRYNEKLKRLSTVLGAGGMALLIAALLRSNDDGLTGTVAGWFFLATIVMLVSVHMNELLAPEDAS